MAGARHGRLPSDARVRDAGRINPAATLFTKEWGGRRATARDYCDIPRLTARARECLDRGQHRCRDAMPSTGPRLVSAVSNKTTRRRIIQNAFSNVPSTEREPLGAKRVPIFGFVLFGALLSDWNDNVEG
jgi:hypothetical protein